MPSGLPCPGDGGEWAKERGGEEEKRQVLSFPEQTEAQVDGGSDVNTFGDSLHSFPRAIRYLATK